MADYDNTNTGVLFVNANKKSDKAPDYSGTFNFNGKEVKIAGWKRQSKTGNTFLSLKVDDYKKQDSQPIQEIPVGDLVGDDLPF